MPAITSIPPVVTASSDFAEHRLGGASVALFTLIELDPRSVVDGALHASGFLAKDATPAGRMRETCPHCDGAPLQLVLRYGHVIRAHLFCNNCTRCFDALDPHGRSALTPLGWSID